MAGHSHWKQIKQHKGAADQRRGQLFSKLLRAIAVAARIDSNPQFNPRLRATMEKARELNVPQENINRAVEQATKGSKNLEEVVIEAYGPVGSAILILAITDNRNRLIQEIRTAIKEHGAKWAEPGSVRWAFKYNLENNAWESKFPQIIAEKDQRALSALVAALRDHSDIQAVYHSAAATEGHTLW